MKKTALKISVFAACFFVLGVFGGFRVHKTDGDGIKLPILMYHAVVPDRYSADAYTIKIKDFTADLDYIESGGYTTVLPSEVIAYCEGRGELPEKPIMITFDDGFCGVKNLALPELEKRGQRAAVAVVGKFSEREEDRKLIYGYLSVADCAEMLERGTFEIASHSYGLHALSPRKGVKRLWRESDADYTRFLQEDTEKLHELLAAENIRPEAYAYPFGAFDKLSDSILKDMGYKMTFGCCEKINVIRRGGNLYGMKRFNRSGVGKSARQILKNL